MQGGWFIGRIFSGAGFVDLLLVHLFLVRPSGGQSIGCDVDCVLHTYLENLYARRGLETAACVSKRGLGVSCRWWVWIG